MMLQERMMGVMAVVSKSRLGVQMAVDSKSRLRGLCLGLRRLLPFRLLVLLRGLLP